MLNGKRVIPMLASLVLAGSIAMAQEATDSKKPQTEAMPPPELTDVSGRLMMAADTPAKGGIAYFVFQRRLMEIPHENSLDKVRAMAETAVAIDEEGSFTLTMSPGNYVLVYDPAATATEANLQPGPESQAAATKRTTPEQLKGRIETIRENAKKGLPIKNQKLGDAYVIENRAVRPPVVEFGEMILGQDHAVTVKATNEDGSAIDFPAALRLRGKSGDIYEPHPPSVSEQGVYRFHDVFPQTYEVFGLASRPKEGMGDKATTPTVTNGIFLFEGEPIEHKVVVKPGSENATTDDTPPPTPAANRPKN